eukprot:TRINITY_DN199_c0_g1_i1.p1 TRINITY_DN199_c0_g1~~TRINITY_DN199_c0_g1_i1.p1  ORF type:complete len:449 (+),score=27.27 TRINITY_DN199_c0_g1_i1:61-1347(+)
MEVCLACLTCDPLCGNGYGWVCLGKRIPSSITSRIGFAVQFLFVIMLGFLALEFGNNLFSWNPEIKCSDLDPYCVGIVSVMRIMFSLTIYHLMLSLLFIGVKTTVDPRDELQKSWWGLKIVILFCFITGFFFIPNVFFVYYNWVALVGAGIFVIIQLAWLVDFAYSWAESWTTKAENSPNGKMWYFALLFSSFVLYLASIISTIQFYIFFASAVDCYYNILLVTINVICSILYTLASLHQKIRAANPKVGILQSSVVTAYTTYLVASTMMSEPSSCNPSFFEVGPNFSLSGLEIFILILGSLITIFAVCFSTLTTTVTTSEIQGMRADPFLSEFEDDVGRNQQYVEPEGDVAYNYTFFHLTFALAAMYMSQLLTNWNTLSGTPTNLGQYEIVDFGWSTVFVKMASIALVILLYFWSLVAPLFFQGREW